LSHTGSLRVFVVQRVLLSVPLLLMLLTIVFVLMRVIPGDPIAIAAGDRLSEEQLQERRAAAGFDRPLWLQYVEYLGQMLTLNFGSALTDSRPVGSILLQNGGATVTLTVAAMLFALVVGIPLGVISAGRRDGVADVAIRLIGPLTYAAPAFFVGLLMQLVFGVWWGLLPTAGQASTIVIAETPRVTNILLIDTLLAGRPDFFMDTLAHLILPGVTLGLLMVGVVIRLVRVNMLQTLSADHVEAAVARGIPAARVSRNHGLRNALVPVVTVMGLQAAALLSGAILTEATFNWPGVGNQLVQYLNARDYTAVQGLVTAFAVIVVLVSLLIDLINALIDPRVKYA